MSKKRGFWRDWLALGLIILTSAACLFYRLDQLPMLHGDEGASGVQAMLFGKETNKNLFKMGWAEQPMLSFAFQSLFLNLFGNNVLGLRSASVSLALLSIVPFFLILRCFLSFSYREAVVTTCFYSFSHWFIAMGRLGINYIHIVPFELFSLFFLLWAFRVKPSFGQKTLFLMAGFLAGVAVYFYHAGRLVPFLLVGCFSLLSPLKKKLIRKNLLCLVIFLLGLAVCLIPFLNYYAKDPGFLIRTKDVLIFDRLDDVARHYGVNNKLGVVFLQFINTAKVFFTGSDNSEQYGYQGPMIPLVFQPFLLLGLFLAVVDFAREPIKRCLVFCFGAILFFGGVLTIGPYPPFMPRLAGAMPFIFCFLGLGIKRVGELKIFRRHRLPVFFIFLVTAWAFVNLRTYFLNYVSSLKAGWANYEPATTIGRYLAPLGAEGEAIFFGCSRFYPTQGNIDFLAYQVKRRGGLELDQAIESSEPERKSLVFIFLPYQIEEERDWWEGYRKNVAKPRPKRLDWQNEIQALKDKFPAGSLKEFFRSDGSLLFSAYEVKGE